MKYAAALALALTLAGCGGGEPLDELYTRQATAACQAQGLAEGTSEFKSCFGPAYDHARDVR
jgi:uncharacterized lipoprotein YmbA